MTDDASDGLFEAMLELGQLQIAGQSLDDLVVRVADIAPKVAAGRAIAGVTMLRDGSPFTVTISDPAGLTLDEAQYEHDRGPCLAALRSGQIVVIEDMTAPPDADDWAAFREAAIAAGVHSSISVPLQVRGRGAGAMNFYSRSAPPIDPRLHRSVEIFRVQAEVALANAEVYWRTVELADNLRTALENRDLIGQAKGVLMAQRRIGSDEAFALLRETSQRRNVKLRDIAEQVTRTGTLPD